MIDVNMVNIFSQRELKYVYKILIDTLNLKICNLNIRNFIYLIDIEPLNGSSKSSIVSTIRNTDC